MVARQRGRRRPGPVAVALHRSSARPDEFRSGPELKSLLDGARGPGSSAEPAADRWRQTQRIVDLLERACRDSPLLVVVDDLHWTDAASQQSLPS